MSNAWQLLQDAGIVCWKRRSKAAVAMLTDILFFLAYGFFSAPLYLKIYEYSEVLFGELAVSSPGLLTSYAAGESFGVLLRQNPALQAIFWKLIALYVLTFLVLYAVYCLFQGFAWRMAFAVLEEIPLQQFLKQFFFANILWMLFYILYHFLSLLVLYQSTVAERYASEQPIFLQGSLLVYAFLLSYFAFLSYCFIGREKGRILWKHAFALGWKQGRKLFPYVLVLVLAFLLLNFFFLGLTRAGLQEKVRIAIGILVVIPALTWGRVYWKMGVEQNLR
ncbi:hypothetical protein HYS48_02995 [Candidatus Woesearchaeota archaeon]|nr:hypothetical protein [Candidatus Woesearchaeota archaeon]